ncbi:hypothetical protein LBMAG48_28080 [Phycisphaerae bacterium]|nr:hypothetical protein LBMAG48_28080 [Phycisphaerae bacterium]
MPTAPECPRCGYDLAGQIAAWHPNGDSLDGANCPTQSTCSECGLTFEWRALLNPTISGPTWFLETTRHKYLRATRVTWLQALRPWTFWRTISLELRPRPRRILLSLALLLATFFLLHAVIGFSGRVGIMTLSPNYPTRWASARTTDLTIIAKSAVSQFARDWNSTFLFRNDTDFQPRYLPVWFGPMVAFTCMPPFMLLCLPWTLARSKVRLSHIARASLYVISPLVALLVIVLVCDLVRYIAGSAGWHRADYFDYLTSPLRWLHPFNRSNGYRASNTAVFYAITLFLWYLIYWYQVLRHGWRMADYRPVYFALIIPAILLTLLILVLIPGAMLMTV